MGNSYLTNAIVLKEVMRCLFNKGINGIVYLIKFKFKECFL